jgi:hypothetical protein
VDWIHLTQNRFNTRFWRSKLLVTSGVLGDFLKSERRLATVEEPFPRRYFARCAYFLTQSVTKQKRSSCKRILGKVKSNTISRYGWISERGATLLRSWFPVTQSESFLGEVRHSHSHFAGGWHPLECYAVWNASQDRSDFIIRLNQSLNSTDPEDDGIITLKKSVTINQSTTCSVIQVLNLLIVISLKFVYIVRNFPICQFN